MSDLVLYLSLAVIGYIVGSRLREHKEKIVFVNSVQTVAIAVLLLTMGARMGSNEEIIHNLNIIGLYALIFTVVVEAFSVAGVSLMRRVLGYDKTGTLRLSPAQNPGEHHVKAQRCEDLPKDTTCEDSPKDATCEGLPKDATCEALHGDDVEQSQGGNKMTILIVVTVALGMAFGYLMVHGGTIDYGVFNGVAGLVIRVGLCCLLLLVGLDMGLEGTLIKTVKEAGFRVFIFPLTIILSTLLASFACSMFLPLTVRESMAIGAGLAWYSLAPVIIMEAGFMTASAISFMHNVLRELMTLLLIPTVAKHVGFLETIALSASGSMDVCLPIIVKATSSKMVLYSFVSGIGCSMAVPILVPLFIG